MVSGVKMSDDLDQFEFIKKRIDLFLEERNWKKYHTPKNLAMSIAIESSELMELFQWEDPPVEEVISNLSLFEKTKDELADIIIYSISLARSLNIDLFECIIEKIDKNTQRFPTINKKRTKL